MSESTPVPRILLIDDHAVVASALTTALRMNGFEDVRHADPRELDDGALLAEAARHDSDIVIVDLFLGDERLGVELVQSLHDAGHAVVVLTGSTERVLHTRALAAGAEAVVEKGGTFADVLRALDAVAKGEPVLSPSERARLVSDADVERARVHQEESHRVEGLTRLSQREQQVLSRLIAGAPAKGIAAELGVSLPTVRTQIRSLFAKLGVRNQRNAIVLALQAGWQPDPEADAD